MGNVRILSRSNEAFDDRATAGRLLAAELAEYRGRQPVILGVPRGGVIVAREVAHALDGVVDVVLAHKLGAPGHTELALGEQSPRTAGCSSMRAWWPRSR
jgi:putative phosphoribosyl transferase